MESMAQTRAYRMTTMALVAMGLVCARAVAQTSRQTPTAAEAATSDAPVSSAGVVMDQVVAIVNGDLVLESDIDEERRFAAFQPFSDKTKPFTREVLVERLVDRALVLQQEKVQPQQPITDTDLTAQLATLRKDIPACKQYRCETEAGWQKFIADQGFTVPELMERWRDRMRVLRFIEMRFRMGIRISPADIQTYYEKTLLPEYAKQKAAPPKLEAISDRIQEILLQQQVGALLEDWLTSLKAQGTVRMAKVNGGRP